MIFQIYFIWSCCIQLLPQQWRILAYKNIHIKLIPNSWSLHRPFQALFVPQMRGTLLPLLEYSKLTASYVELSSKIFNMKVRVNSVRYNTGIFKYILDLYEAINREGSWYCLFREIYNTD